MQKIFVCMFVTKHQHQPNTKNHKDHKSQRGSRGYRSSGDLNHVDYGDVTTDDNDDQVDADKKGPDRSWVDAFAGDIFETHRQHIVQKPA